MITFQCIECDMDLEIDDSASLGQKIRCIYCGAEFEVVALDPLEVDWADEEEEDPLDDAAAGVDHLDENILVDRVLDNALIDEGEEDELDGDTLVIENELDDELVDDEETDDEIDDWDLDEDDLDELEDEELDEDEWEWDLDDEEDRWS